jgi:hypothetical protein
VASYQIREPPDIILDVFKCWASVLIVFIRATCILYKSRNEGRGPELCVHAYSDFEC